LLLTELLAPKQGYARDTGDLIRIRDGASLIYALQTVGFVGASAACLLAPEATLSLVSGNRNLTYLQNNTIMATASVTDIAPKLSLKK
jgi:hypothetical protein